MSESQDALKPRRDPRSFEVLAPPDAGRTDEPLLLAHLERDLQLIRRYAFVHSNLSFKPRVPLVGGLLAVGLNAARAVLRGMLTLAMGTQDEFNAAVAQVLLEFTRRAATRNPLTPSDSALDEALRILSTRASTEAQANALKLVAREVQLLREQVRAAQLTATENERQASELLRRIAALEEQRTWLFQRGDAG